MARERDPARDKAYEMWKKSNGKITNREIANALDVNEKKIATWKTRDKWNCSTTKKENVVQQNKKCSTTNKKKIKEIAKALIEEGHTLSEVAKQTETPRGTIGRWSAEENLQQSQLEHLKRFREKYKERIERNKLLRLETNEEALEAISYEIKSWENNGKISKAAMEKLIMNEEAEQLILEVVRIERMEKNITEVPVDEEKKKELVIKVIE
ncbi:phage terminase small subunit-related protein [Cetobacterium somerae]|uniref:phage terminase small subunit-related protein n=1 Tax=Cetobacterium somerae TaxID=188913 RepID=UPI003D76A2E0